MPIMVAESSFKPGDEVEYISEIPTLPHLEGVDETVAAFRESLHMLRAENELPA